MPFPLRDIRKKSSQHVRACAAGDGAICSKNRKIVPYHGANPNTRNGARLRSPSPIMAPGLTRNPVCIREIPVKVCGVCPRRQKTPRYGPDIMQQKWVLDAGQLWLSSYISYCICFTTQNFSLIIKPDHGPTFP